MNDFSDKIMDYAEGSEFMRSISKKGGDVGSFRFRRFTISYPGYKIDGDYRLSLTDGGSAPKHTDIIDIIETTCTSENRNLISDDLEKIFLSGLKADTILIDEDLKAKIFWITLQEDINYPPPRYKGKRLPMQRFFEATLICLGIISKDDLYNRTNNHGKKVPELIELENLTKPVFYS